MERMLIVTTLVLLLLATLAGAAYAATDATDPSVLKHLAAVRQATTKYHDVNVALADGFIRTPHCIQEPGLGGMGMVWTLVDSCLDFDILTEYSLTDQNRHYTITKTYKSQHYIVFSKTWTSNSIYAPPVHFPSGPQSGTD